MTPARQADGLDAAPNGRLRVVIEGVHPQLDGGRFQIKRAIGEAVVVEADAFCDGHDAVAASLRWRHRDAAGWTERPMEPIGGDRWRGSFEVTELGVYEYSLSAWVDRFETWRRGLRKKVEASQNVSVDLLQGAELVEGAATRAPEPDRRTLEAWAERLSDVRPDPGAGLSDELAALMAQYPDRTLETRYALALEVRVDPPLAGFGAWYEFFPRSCGEGSTHGTFAEAERMLPYVARMGFDIVYLPPIHPIGTTNRKGKNNSVVSEEGDVGSPWAIGSEDGGHDAVHPDLGTLEDLGRFVRRAREHGLEVAMDLAFQCSPDHPWAKEHLEWFRRRPDGTIQFAENPPKRYEDIYPIDFETEAWAELWDELLRLVKLWVDRGITVFRVDNPHTKPLPFWDWLIGTVKAAHPEVVFLSEAFTRPKLMYALAKRGFTQSYTYFTWRNVKWELTQYFTELIQTDVVEYFRPNLWPNTPDILHGYLQHGGRPAFMARLILAATLGANYGIYGPAFELCEWRAVAPGSEEYLDSEKFQVRTWDLEHPDSLADLIALVNRIRRDNPALHNDRTLRFHEVSNDQLIAYSKRSPDGEDVILCVVNLDPHHAQSGMLNVPLADFGIDASEPYQVHDLLTDARYLWDGEWNYVRLDPYSVPAHVFHVGHHVGREQDFDYFG